LKINLDIPPRRSTGMSLQTVLTNSCDMKYEINLNDVQKPIITASPEVREIIERVLKLEKEKLYLKTPRNINDDILKIIKEVIQ
jgi:hypothetical protein